MKGDYWSYVSQADYYAQFIHMYTKTTFKIDETFCTDSREVYMTFLKSIALRNLLCSPSFRQSMRYLSLLYSCFWKALFPLEFTLVSDTIRFRKQDMPIIALQRCLSQMLTLLFENYSKCRIFCLILAFSTNFCPV